MSDLPQHISYSSLTTWQECGWKYYLTKVEKVQEAHAVWFTGGTAVHKATEVYDLEGGDPETIWNKVWFDQVKEDEELHGDMSEWQYAKREDMSWWYGEGIWMLEKWIKFRNNGWNVYEDFIEKELRKNEALLEALREIDNRQMFEKDDDVGSIFYQIKETIEKFKQFN